MQFHIDNRSPSFLSHADALADNLADFVLLCARILIGWLFVKGGFPKLLAVDAFGASLAARGVPSFMAYPAVAAEFFGGVALLLGLATRYVAIIMLIFTIAATGISHRYWEFTEAATRRAQESNFYKNLAIMGGILALFVTGAGRFSIDGWLSRKR